MLVDMLEMLIESGEILCVVDGLVLLWLFVADGDFQVVVKLYFSLGKLDLVVDAIYVELLVLGIEIVLFDHAVELVC